jgi:hypothetical protein
MGLIRSCISVNLLTIHGLRNETNEVFSDEQ